MLIAVCCNRHTDVIDARLHLFHPLGSRRLRAPGQGMPLPIQCSKYERHLELVAAPPVLLTHKQQFHIALHSRDSEGHDRLPSVSTLQTVACYIEATTGALHGLAPLPHYQSLTPSCSSNPRDAATAPTTAIVPPTKRAALQPLQAIPLHKLRRQRINHISDAEDQRIQGWGEERLQLGSPSPLRCRQQPRRRPRRSRASSH